MSVLIIDNETTLLNKLQELVPGETTILKWSNLDYLQENDYSAVVLSGGSRFEINGNEKKLSKEIEIIRTWRIPIIGICYGFELIARAWGGKLKKLPVQHKGIIKIKVQNDDPIFEDLKEFEVYENHHWQAERIPADFVVLADSDHSVEVFRHSTRHIFGFQFHPEDHKDKNKGYKIFLNALKTVI